MLTFFSGVVVVLILIGVATFLGYISFGKGARADQIDDDLKGLRDKIYTGDERRK